MVNAAEQRPRFAGLDDGELAALLDLATVRSLPKNVLLVSEHDETDNVHFILAGRIKVFLSDAAGKEIVLSLQGPGEYFGEMALESGGRSASVMTLEPCRIATVKLADFRAFLLQHPEFQHELVRKLIRRVRALTRRVHDLALVDVYGRVVHTLEGLARDENGRQIVPQVLSQQAIASLVGASREMVSRILKELRTGGYIGVEGRRIVILRKPPAAW
jgi:CRP/FNR family cyclic AMP-dependent transcriptional regulator